jgi:hypothetical protein
MGAGSTALGNALLRGKQDAGLSEAPNQSRSGVEIVIAIRKVNRHQRRPKKANAT